jgi:hypothetical protein
MKNQAKLWNLNWFDVGKSFIVIIGTSVFGSLIPIIQTGAIPTKSQLFLIGGTALAAGFIYLLKQRGTNENGQLLK